MNLHFIPCYRKFFIFRIRLSMNKTGREIFWISHDEFFFSKKNILLVMNITRAVFVEMFKTFPTKLRLPFKLPPLSRLEILILQFSPFSWTLEIRLKKKMVRIKGCLDVVKAVGWQGSRRLVPSHRWKWTFVFF